MTYAGDLPNIALIGRAGSGKDTVAQVIRDHFPHLGYQRVALADPLKVMCQTTSDRGLLQRVGVGVRELVEDGWVQLLLHEIERQEATGARIIVTDVRFPNELRALTERGFVAVRVLAPQSKRIERLTANGKLQDVAQLDHPSETALDAYITSDWIVNETNSHEPLVKQLTIFFNRVRR